jgi:hypothetical protein
MAAIASDIFFMTFFSGRAQFSPQAFACIASEWPIGG